MPEKISSEETQKILSRTSAFIREFRMASGLTQLELSEWSGVHANTISHLESGKAFNILTLIEVCIALDLPLKEVFN